MNMNIKKTNNRKTGSALLSIILTMSILSVIGVSIIALTLSNSNQAIYLKHFDNAYYDSESILRLGSDAVKKAATIELAKLQKNGATKLSDSFLTDVKTTALTLVPSSSRLDSDGNEKLTLNVVGPQIQVVARGSQNGLVRTTNVIMNLLDTSEPIPFAPYLDYSLIVGGEVEFNKDTPSMTTIDMTPQGVVVNGIDIEKNRYRVTNMSENLPPNMIWWDFMLEGLISRFETRQQGYTSNVGNIIEIKATGSNYPNENVIIRKGTNTIKVGTLTLSTLKDYIVLVDGNVTFDKNMVYDDGTTTNLMIFATGNVTVDLSAAKKTNISDPLFIFAGDTFYINDKKGGGVHELFVYANTFNYENSATGMTDTVLNGQFLIKENFIFDSINGSIKMDVTCVNNYLTIFYKKMNDLADDNIIVNQPTDGSGTILSTGNLFSEGKIVEIPNIN